MSKFKSLEYIYEVSTRAKHSEKDTTRTWKQLTTAKDDLKNKRSIWSTTATKAEQARNAVNPKDYIEAIPSAEHRAEYLMDPTHTPDGYDDYVKKEKEIQKKNLKKARRETYNDVLGSTQRDYAKAKRTLRDVESMLKSAERIENPKPPRTLSDEYSQMYDGGSEFKDSHGNISPMDSEYTVYKEFSKEGKDLYSKIREFGNKGKRLEDITNKTIEGIKSPELAKVMKLAISMGYELSDTLYFVLDEMNPKLATAVSKYSGHDLSHREYMRSDHPYYTNIYNQYLRKYGSDPVKAKEMLKLFRKHAQHQSKMYGDNR